MQPSPIPQNSPRIQPRVGVRINIYNDAIRDRVERKIEPVRDAESVQFCGVRIYFGNDIPHTEIDGHVDDDTGAVTFWFNGSYEKNLLRTAFK